ncbi:MAG: hypothetical protein HZB17_11875 [Chloroflexi bacterium]|nr:hypothetical protein [Chloroflexota bacterium]
MFDNLQRVNSELLVAYNATIEGWSRALDLRDQETEGHTQRVTEMALNLAIAMSVELDIPLCHHEKWDGTGYPRQLKGEQIPLVARIFAVVDVWDALISDRPYRAAWPRDKVSEYIREQSGLHFEPRVVEMFLNMIETH